METSYLLLLCIGLICVFGAALLATAHNIAINVISEDVKTWWQNFNPKNFSAHKKYIILAFVVILAILVAFMTWAGSSLLSQTPTLTSTPTPAPTNTPIPGNVPGSTSGIIDLALLLLSGTALVLSVIFLIKEIRAIGIAINNKNEQKKIQLQLQLQLDNDINTLLEDRKLVCYFCLMDNPNNWGAIYNLSSKLNEYQQGNQSLCWYRSQLGIQEIEAYWNNHISINHLSNLQIQEAIQNNCNLMIPCIGVFNQQNS